MTLPKLQIILLAEGVKGRRYFYLETSFHLDLHAGRPLTQSDYTGSCINIIVLLRMST
jgi:hypothetical protein